MSHDTLSMVAIDSALTRPQRSVRHNRNLTAGPFRPFQRAFGSTEDRLCCTPAVLHSRCEMTTISAVGSRPLAHGQNPYQVPLDPFKGPFEGGCAAQQMITSFLRLLAHGRWRMATCRCRPHVRLLVHHRAARVRAPPQHGLSSKNTALITSDYGVMRSLSIKWL